MQNAIEIEHLKKYYGEVKAVDDISFTVKQGEFFAFLGVNGAGKSTTISILCGKEQSDGGTVRIEGLGQENLDEVKKRLGVVFQDCVLDRPLSVYDNLRYRAALYGITGQAFEETLKELCALFDLTPILKRPVDKLSGGQRRRIDIARALLHRPNILILDEPTTGLDPQTRKSVWEIVHRLRKERNMTVFLTTHYMEEAADADNVVIIDSGKILANATPLELKNRYTGDFITFYNAEEEELKALGMPYEKVGKTYRIEVANTEKATELVLKYPKIFRDFEITKGKMDDVFLAVTGRRLEQ
ncbi:MAG: ABC transporter ATP-binding protein [Clostridiales bacterium]|nr:ABC transporter ATP-binding protein [Clostridiales bacterium]